MDELFSSAFTLFNEGAVKRYRIHPYKLQATVLSKRTAGSVCFVAFELSNGKRIEMGVSRQDFDGLNENDRYELTTENGQYTDIKRM